MRGPAAALVLLALLARALAGQCPDGTPPPCGPRQPAAPRYSVAVLTFDNLGLDSADAYLTEGVADAIATRLGQLTRLEVKRPRGLSRPQGVRWPGSLGRVLNVRYLVEGSVQRAGALVRYSVRLDRADGVQVWAREYDRSASDPLGVQADIAGDVAGGVVGRLLPSERARVAARPPDPRAEEHFRRGNYLLGRRASAILPAIAEYDAALRLAPDYVPALALGAYARALGAWWGVLPLDSGVLTGFALADRALRRDSTSSLAWMALGMLRSIRNLLDQRPAAEAMERAVRLDPRNDEAWHQLAQLRGYLGRFAAADSAVGRALALDPTRAISLVYRAELRTLGHEFAAARRALDSAIALEPGLAYAYQARAVNALMLGDSAAARQDAAAALAGGGDRPDLHILMDVAAGRPDSARARIAAQVGHLTAAGPIELMNTASWAALLGERDVLLRIFGVVPAGHLRWYGAQFPAFDRYRSDPVIGPLLEAGRPTP